MQLYDVQRWGGEPAEPGVHAAAVPQLPAGGAGGLRLHPGADQPLPHSPGHHVQEASSDMLLIFKKALVVLFCGA